MELTKLKEIRKAKGVSIKELSKNVGINRDRISLIERGLVNPSWGTVVKIIEELGYKLVVIA